MDVKFRPDSITYSYMWQRITRIFSKYTIFIFEYTNGLKSAEIAVAQFYLKT
jgi:hypothetical protein